MIHWCCHITHSGWDPYCTVRHECYTTLPLCAVLLSWENWLVSVWPRVVRVSAACVEIMVVQWCTCRTAPELRRQLGVCRQSRISPLPVFARCKCHRPAVRGGLYHLDVRSGHLCAQHGAVLTCISVTLSPSVRHPVLFSRDDNT